MRQAHATRKTPGIAGPKRRGRSRRSAAFLLLSAMCVSVLQIVGAGGASGQVVEAAAPDPSGIEFIGGNTLLVSDSEVEELNVPGCIANYSGFNLWEYNFSTDTPTPIGTTFTDGGGYSAEPTGLGAGTGGTMWIADDVDDEITEVGPGTDGDFGTADDVVLHTFETDAYSSDIEGVAFDGTNLFAIAGELSLEPDHIYVLNAATGAVVNDFPVPSYAGPTTPSDTPGIAYHAGTDRLLVLDDFGGGTIVQVNKTNGALIGDGITINPPNSANTPGHVTSHTQQDLAIVGGTTTALDVFTTDRRADPGEPGTSQTCTNDGQLHRWTLNLTDDTGSYVSTENTWAWETPPPVVFPAATSVGVARGNTYFVNNGSTTNQTFTFASATDYPLAGDFDDDGDAEIAVVRGNVWYVSNGTPPTAVDHTFAFGKATDFPIVGDWDGDGEWTPGLVRGNTWFLSNQMPPTAIDHQFVFGKATDYPIAGDWNGDGEMTPGLVRGNTWFLSNQVEPTAINHQFAFGKSTDFPVVGDWDGNNSMTPGVVRGNVWFLSNQATPTAINYNFAFAKSTDFPIVGDWDGS